MDLLAHLTFYKVFSVLTVLPGPLFYLCRQPIIFVRRNFGGMKAVQKYNRKRPKFSVLSCDCYCQVILYKIVVKN